MILTNEQMEKKIGRPIQNSDTTITTVPINSDEVVEYNRCENGWIEGKRYHKSFLNTKLQ